MLEYVYREVAIEIPVGKIKSLLAVPDAHLDAWMCIRDVGRHIRTQFHGVVLTLLLRQQSLVVQVLPQTSSDLDRAAEVRTRVLDGERVIEPLNDPIPLRQDLVPSLYEVVVNALLLGCQYWQDLRPLLSCFWHR